MWQQQQQNQQQNNIRYELITSWQKIGINNIWSQLGQLWSDYLQQIDPTCPLIFPGSIVQAFEWAPAPDVEWIFITFFPTDAYKLIQVLKRHQQTGHVVVWDQSNTHLKPFSQELLSQMNCSQKEALFSNETTTEITMFKQKKIVWTATLNNIDMYLPPPQQQQPPNTVPLFGRPPQQQQQQQQQLFTFSGQPFSRQQQQQQPSTIPLMRPNNTQPLFKF